MSDATGPQPNENSELGVTFSGGQERARGEDADMKMRTPTPEDIARDSEASRNTGVFDVAKAFAAKHELGTIVTDKKRGRTSLAENLQSAWGQWWGGVKKNTAPVISELGEKVEKRKHAGIRVPKAETRAAVVETAATHATIAPKDDHQVVIERVKTFKRDVERVTGSPFIVKDVPEKPEDAAPRWTHTVDDAKKPPAPAESTPDLRSAMVAPIVAKRIERDINDFYTTHPAKRAALTPRKSTVANQLAYMHIPGTVAKRRDPIPRKPTVAPIVTHEDNGAFPLVSRDISPEQVAVGYVAKARTEAPEKPVRQGPAEAVPAPQAPSQADAGEESPPEFHEERERRAGTVERADALHTPIFGDRMRAALIWGAAPGAVVLTTIIFIILMGGGVRAPENGERETPVAVAPEETLINVEVQSPIPLANHRAFMEALAGSISRAPTGISQFYPTAPFENGEHTLTAPEFFRTIGTGLPEGAVRTLDDEFVLGSISGPKNEAFIILRSSNFDALFAGMLTWERTIFRDLSPLFDDTYVEAASFTDRVRDNRPVRILYDALGGEAMAYAFIDKHTVVITASADALARIADEM